MNGITVSFASPSVSGLERVKFGDEERSSGIGGLVCIWGTEPREYRYVQIARSAYKQGVRR